MFDLSIHHHFSSISPRKFSQAAHQTASPRTVDQGAVARNSALQLRVVAPWAVWLQQLLAVLTGAVPSPLPQASGRF
jgi:hypothetical protein